MKYDIEKMKKVYIVTVVDEGNLASVNAFDTEKKALDYISENVDCDFDGCRGYSSVDGCIVELTQITVK